MMILKYSTPIFQHRTKNNSSGNLILSDFNIRNDLSGYKILTRRYIFKYNRCWNYFLYLVALKIDSLFAITHMIMRDGR